MKKGLIIAAAMILAVCLGIGGTLAYIFVQSETVTNTFTYGDVNITLKEDKLNSDGTLDATTPVNSNTYDYIPGVTLNKRPYVTVKATSQACYVFIKVDETNNKYTGLEGNIIQWAVDTSVWTKLENVNNVWYKLISDETTTDTSYDVLLNDKVTVNSNVTKTMINEEKKNPQLTFTAYAIQQVGFSSATAAWTELVKQYPQN